jgi:glutathione synthase/RimK-type ligase-like ATP-grasp enzyme
LILLATNKRDVTTDFVVLELRRRGLDFVRLNTEDLPSFEMQLPGGDPAALSLRDGETLMDLQSVTRAYYRRPGMPEAPDKKEGTATYLLSEWSAVLRSLWNALEGRWLNSPFDILRAEDKPRQLAAARQVGFSVPDTLVTNAFEAARDFIDQGPTVGKPLRHALLDDGERGAVIFTSRIERLHDADAPPVRRAPMILQREIRKRCDLRVIVIEDRVFATEIGSQAHEETMVDWRRGARSDLAHEPFALPADIAEACTAVTRALGLRFAAIDLVEDQSGHFWFLEANPNGQWAWIEQRTGAPITAAIVDWLAQ